MRMRTLTGLVCVLLCGVAAEAIAQGMVRVSAERTSLRERPATDAPVVAILTRGDELDVLETSGAWFRVRVRSNSREGFVHNLFVERGSGAAPAPAAPAPTAAAPPPTTNTPAPAAAPQPPPQPQRAAPAGNSVQSSVSSGASDYRTFGAGVSSGGLAWGLTPSVRFWFSETVGLEVNASFFSGGSVVGNSYSVTAISPSVMVKFGEGWRAGPVAFAPYAGGGVTIWRYSNDYNNYYCDLVECDSSSMGFGGFGGVEVGFDAVPRLTASASVGFYTSPSNLGYAGLYTSVAAHWYFK